MKSAFSLLALLLGSVLLPSCTKSLPPLPEGRRPAVGPDEGNKSYKAWNRGSHHESDALLPFTTPRR